MRLERNLLPQQVSWLVSPVFTQVTESHSDFHLMGKVPVWKKKWWSTSRMLERPQKPWPHRRFCLVSSVPWQIIGTGSSGVQRPALPCVEATFPDSVKRCYPPQSQAQPQRPCPFLAWAWPWESKRGQGKTECRAGTRGSRSGVSCATAPAEPHTASGLLVFGQEGRAEENSCGGQGCFILSRRSTYETV